MEQAGRRERRCGSCPSPLHPAPPCSSIGRTAEDHLFENMERACEVSRDSSWLDEPAGHRRGGGTYRARDAAEAEEGRIGRAQPGAGRAATQRSQRCVLARPDARVATYDMPAGV
jgi:hypothetical protein